MFKVLIVDDEPIVREGLKTIIDWEQYGFSVCGEGVDGNDGLNKILSMNPELVLMDIKMPGMHGIDVIKEAKQKGFKGKVIILTGYSDFEYAKSAIGFGVNSYLLKPIDEDELIVIVKNLRKEIEEQYKTEKYLSISKKHLKSRVINDLISGEQLPENIKEDLEVCNLCFDYRSFQVAVIDENSLVKEDKSHFCIRIGEILAGKKDVEVFSMDGSAVIIFKGKDKEEIQRNIDTVYKALESGTENGIFTAVGRQVSSLEGIHISYKDVKKIMDRRFLYQEQRIVYWESAAVEIMCGRNFEKLDTENLFISIEVGDMEKLSEILEEMEIQFKQSMLTTEKIKGLCANCFIELKERITLNYAEHKNIFPSNETVMHNVYDKSSLRNLMDYMKVEFTGTSKAICNADSDNTIKRVLNYIQKNYYKDLKLELLAEIFCYNSSYLGKIFKNFTGEHFNAYLDKVRIENAKVLLQDGLKVYQVSEKVGYKSIDYFYSKFKKHVGVSPKEYKKL